MQSISLFSSFSSQTRRLVLRVIVFGSLLSSSWALDASPETSPPEDVRTGFTTPIPSGLLTPDEVPTSIGTFRFFDGFPDKESARLAYENLDFIRGYETFLALMPAASMEMLRQGHAEQGIDGYNKIMLMSPLGSNPLLLTGNTDTVYGINFFDLSKTGPLVIQVPSGLGPGTVNDAYFRFVCDMGGPGPDKGLGGKYLILGPDDEEPEDIEGYFVFRSPTFANVLVLRAFTDETGKPDAAVANYEAGLRIYPWSLRDNPPEMEFIEGGQLTPFNTIHANNFKFFEELDLVIQREPVDFLDPELRGLAASIGLEKGVPFNPSPERRSILEKALDVGVAYVRADGVKPRDPSAYLFQNKQWYSFFLGGSHEWLRHGGQGGARYLDARTMFFWMATLNTPAMVLEMPGVGSQYAGIATDAEKNYLDGGKNYKLTLPANIPAKDFWSLVVYDPQTRSELQTSQPYPSKNSKRNHNMTVNKDGSTDLYFGPEAPENMASNWIETVPGKGWFAVLRLYGPLQSWFDQTWQPDDIQKMP